MTPAPNQCDTTYWWSLTSVTGKVASAQETVWWDYFIQWAETGAATWDSKANLTVAADAGAGATSEFGQYTLGVLIDTIQNPGVKTLQPLTITNFIANGGGSYTIAWTTPANTDYLRVKYSTTGQITDWIGYSPATATFIGNPATQTNWFASTDATGIPSPVPGSQSMTVTGLSTGLNSGNFSVKAFAPAACNISPTSLPSGTVGVSYSQTLTNSLCSSSTWSLSGSLPAGLGGCSSGSGSTCMISGTPSGAGTSSFTVSYDTASDPVSILINSSGGSGGATISGGATVSGKVTIQ